MKKWSDGQQQLTQLRESHNETSSISSLIYLKEYQSDSFTTYFQQKKCSIKSSSDIPVLV